MGYLGDASTYNFTISVIYTPLSSFFFAVYSNTKEFSSPERVSYKLLFTFFKCHRRLAEATAPESDHFLTRTDGR